MRVLHVSEVSSGGVSALLSTFVAEQAASGHEAHVLAPEAYGCPPSGEHHPWQMDRHKPATLPSSLRQLHDVYKRVRPDVVHLHSFFAGQLGRWPYPSARRGRPATVYQAHGWNYDAAKNRGSLALLIALEKFAERRTDVVVANCRDEVLEGQRRGVRVRAEVLGMPLDCHRYAPVESRERDAHRRALGLGTTQVAVCLGNLSWQKGQDRLVQEWERAPVPDTTLVLVGGDERPQLRQLGPPVLQGLAPRQWDRSIRPVGHHDDVRPWLWAADVLVQPSRYESHGVAVAEAMACGIPVVTFDVNGAREVIEDGPEAPAGEVVAQGDVVALLAAVERTTHDAGLHQRQATAARERALRRFGVAEVMQRLQHSYLTACAIRAQQVPR